MGWYPGAIRKVVTRHRTLRKRDRGICLHVAVSESASLFGYFNQSGNPTSHFYVRRDGTPEQYVDSDFIAPAQLEGNPTMISIETQGGVSNVDTEKWTTAQLETMAGIAAWAHKLHGIPLQIMRDSRPATEGIGWHRLGVDPYRVEDGELWSSAYAKTCPGTAKIAQIPGIITRARTLATPTTEEDSMAAMTTEQIAAMLDALKRDAAASEEIAQLLRTNAVRMDYLTNNVVPRIAAGVASLLELAMEDDPDTEQIRALVAEIRDDVDRQADVVAGPDAT